MKQTKGMTLIEVLIGAAAMGIIGVIIVTIMVNGSGVLFSQNTQVNQSLSLNFVSTKLHDTIQIASSISASFVSGPNNYTTSSNTLVFQIPSVNLSGSPIDGKFDTIIIAADSQKPKLLKKYVYPDPSSSRSNKTETLVNNLSKIDFIYLNSSGVTVNPTNASTIDYVVNVAEKSSYDTKESSISGRVNLKNY